jgi:NTE family protein
MYPLMKPLLLQVAVFIGTLFVMCAQASGQAERVAPSEAAKSARPKIGLVLSGGGARGIAHIGVLKELEAARIPIDFVAGTSMGAIVGGLYASGMPPDELEKQVLAMDWDAAFSARPPREDLSLRRKADDVKFSLPIEFGLRDGELRAPSAAVGSAGLERMLKTLTRDVPAETEFDRLPIPFRAVATDLVTGEQVVLSRGDLPVVLRASMSVPAAFTPVEIDGRLLVDGGLVNNLPIDIVRRMGADVVIAVNIGTPLLPRESLQSVFGVGVQMLNILTEQNVRVSLASLRARDVLLTPDLSLISSTDFKLGRDAIDRGAESARGVIALLSDYELAPDAHAQQITQLRAATRSVRIDEIRAEGQQTVSPQSITAAFVQNVGAPFDRERVERDLSWLYGRGDFERLEYRLVTEREKNVLLIRAQEKNWGPNYFRFGFGFNTDFKAQGQFSIVGAHTARWMNSLGAEWSNEIQLGRNQRIATQWYQPLDASETFFATVGAERRRRVGDVSLSDRDRLTTRPIAEYQLTDVRGVFDLGIALGRYGEVRFGPLLESQSVVPRVGQLDLPSFRANLSGLQGSFVIDQRDSAVFARSGYRLEANALRAFKAFGADAALTRVQWSAEYAKTFGATTVDIAARGARINRAAGGAFPQFELGGFLQLSGLRSGQLRGDSIRFGRVMAFQQLGLLPAFGRGVYVGASLEAGDIDDTYADLDVNKTVFGSSLFIGLDTAIGPFYVGVGRASRGRHAAYLYLGRP